MEDACSDPNTNSTAIAKFVNARGIYMRNPTMSHYCSVTRKRGRNMATTRAMEVATMDGYINLLNNIGTKLKLLLLKVLRRNGWYNIR